MHRLGVESTARASFYFYNTKAEAIGTIDDVVLGADGKAATAVISIGGFLGLGRKIVAVPYAALKVGPVVESSRVRSSDLPPPAVTISRGARSTLVS